MTFSCRSPRSSVIFASRISGGRINAADADFRRVPSLSFNFTVLPADFVFVRISSKKLSERGSSMASLNRSDADAWSLNKRERNMTRTSCVDFGCVNTERSLKWRSTPSQALKLSDAIPSLTNDRTMKIYLVDQLNGLPVRVRRQEEPREYSLIQIERPLTTHSPND